MYEKLIKGIGNSLSVGEGELNKGEFNNFYIEYDFDNKGIKSGECQLLLNVMGREEVIDVFFLGREQNMDYTTVTEMINDRTLESLSSVEKMSILKPYTFTVNEFDGVNDRENKKVFNDLYSFRKYIERVGEGDYFFGIFMDSVSRIAEVKLKLINEILETNFTFDNLRLDDNQLSLLVMNAY